MSGKELSTIIGRWKWQKLSIPSAIKKTPLIEQRDNELEISRDKLMAEVLNNYAERISEKKAAETIHTQLDSLMLNQNRLIEATNNSASSLSEAIQEQMKMNQSLMPGMSLENISKVLFSAYANNQALRVQEKVIVDGIVPAIISGMVKGYDEEYVFIGGTKIAIDSINWIEDKK
ncbi:hypothetical protein G7084_05765 [Weissella coleopterorum]|uniref:Uncharacterized protein n=1 Tax=Weissella coleopterorum TaxID=2714949 RepID=A0A6G8AY88_9LACO|nr:hypothetical protein [Weissella coleopterorum]QIL49843.1 hypothetical protein G7084_05765 [Weissella coleopterorum]